MIEEYSVVWGFSWVFSASKLEYCDLLGVTAQFKQAHLLYVSLQPLGRKYLEVTRSKTSAKIAELIEYRSVPVYDLKTQSKASCTM